MHDGLLDLMPPGGSILRRSVDDSKTHWGLPDGAMDQGLRRSRGTSRRCSRGSGSRTGSSRGTAGARPRRSSTSAAGLISVVISPSRAARQLGAVDLGQLAGGLLLLRRGEVDRRAVLRADVVALAHALGRVVDLEERASPGRRRPPPTGRRRPDRLGVAGAAGADLLVRRVRRDAAGVADRRRPHAGQLPVDLLGAPEAAEPEDRDLVALGHLVGDARARRARGGGRPAGTAAPRGRAAPRRPWAAWCLWRPNIGRLASVRNTVPKPRSRVGSAVSQQTHARQVRLRDACDPRRLRARPDDRRGDPADLRDQDLQAGRRRRAARRLRVQPLRQPDPHRPRGQHRGARGGGARLRVRLRAGRRGHPDPRRLPARRPRGDPRRRVRRHVPALRQGRAGLGPRAQPGAGLRRRRRPRGDPARARPSWSGSRRPPTRCSTSATSRRWPRSPTTPARCSSSTTPSPRRTSSSR